MKRDRAVESQRNNKDVLNDDNDVMMDADNDDNVQDEKHTPLSTNSKKARTTSSTTISLTDDHESPTPPHTDDDNDDNDRSGIDADVWRFFTAPVVSDKEIQVIGPDVATNLQNIVTELEDPELGIARMMAFQQQKNNGSSRGHYAFSDEIENANENDEEDAQVAVQSPDQNWDPRSYQRALLELAKTTNTIVHLGTGTGKVMWKEHIC